MGALVIKRNEWVNYELTITDITSNYYVKSSQTIKIYIF